MHTVDIERRIGVIYALAATPRDVLRYHSIIRANLRWVQPDRALCALHGSDKKRDMARARRLLNRMGMEVIDASGMSHHEQRLSYLHAAVKHAERLPGETWLMVVDADEELIQGIRVRDALRWLHGRGGAYLGLCHLWGPDWGSEGWHRVDLPGMAATLRFWRIVETGSIELESGVDEQGSHCVPVPVVCLLYTSPSPRD